jgi:N-acetylmuramoyl-L-alanine amidase
MKAWFSKLIQAIFKKKEPQVIQVEQKKDAGAGKKIALIVGHGAGDGGAEAFNGMSEFNYNSFVAEEVEKTIKDKQVKVFYRGAGGIAGVAAKAVAWNPDVCIEMHLNSFNKIAAGCEVLVLSGDEESAKLGRKFAASFCSKFNRKTRGDKGVKWLASSERGGLSLKCLSPIKQAILVEPFFCDNKSEWIEPVEYVKFLAEFINEL